MKNVSFLRILPNNFSTDPPNNNSCKCKYNNPDYPHSSSLSKCVIIGWVALIFDTESQVFSGGVIETEVGEDFCVFIGDYGAARA